MPVRPFTASWVLRHIRESPIKTALTQLRVWAPNSQEKLDELLVKKIRNLQVDQALKALHELPHVRRIIKKENPLAFYVSAEIQTTDKDISITAQIDSGCTKSVIDRAFAKRSKLKIKPMAIPRKVEGCNGTILDKVDGSVEICIRIGGHVEAITLWTMELSVDTDVILGYDWLRSHNPRIDWGKGTCHFDNCTNQCLSKWDSQLDSKDKLFAMNV